MDLIDLTGRHSAITTFGAPIISENGTAFDGNSCIFVSDGLADFAFGVGSFTVELDGKPVKSTAALAAGKSETVVLGNGLAAGVHVLVVKSQFMYSECYQAEPPRTPGNWGVDALISVQPK